MSEPTYPRPVRYASRCGLYLRPGLPWLCGVGEEHGLLHGHRTRREAERCIRAAYDEGHALCPRCLGEDLAVGTAGFLSPPDLNPALCACGWAGRVDDLAPRAAGGR